jgi:large subunit ribosomal protein L25
MSKKEITFKAEERTEKGSAAVGRLRRAGFVPASMNRIQGNATMLLKLSRHDFEALLKRYGDEELLLTLEIGGQPVHTLMREVQMDVMTGEPIHADFGEIDMNAKIRVHVPLRLVGEPVGVKLDGGVLQQLVRHIEVACLPADIPEEFTVDVSNLKKGESLFARQIPLDKKYTLVIGPERMAVATVVEPAEEVVAAPAADATAAAAGTEAATPEVIAKGKKEEEGAEGAAAEGKPGEAAKGAKGAAEKGAEKGAEKEKGGKKK